MGSMSNTRKEIAERLGFAADATRPGVKAAFGLFTSISTLPNTGSVNMTAKRFLERLHRVNLKEYEGFENFHRELSEVIAGVVRDTNRSLKDGDQYGAWSGKDLAAILQRKIGRSPALTRTAEVWLDVSMMSRLGAKAKFSAQFEVGRVYEHNFIGDSDARVQWKVLTRTASTMTIKQVGAGHKDSVTGLTQGEEKRVKINSDAQGEFVYPMGRYSMAPILRASRSSGFSRPGAKAK